MRSVTLLKSLVYNSSVSLLTLLILGAASVYSQAPTAPKTVAFTEKDREFALKYLNDTKADFVKEVTGLSDAQLNFRAAPNRWTVAEVAEHIILSEGVLSGLIQGQILKSPAVEGSVFRVNDKGVILAVTNRAEKFTAPEMLKPASRFKTRDDLLTNFDKARNQTIEFVKANTVNMRNHFFENPLMGMIDGYQWLLFAIGHSERHLLQLKEVKADPAFPKK
jgi:hypothetical protein